MIKALCYQKDTTRQKINKETQDLNNTINHVDMNRSIEYLTQLVKYTFFLSADGP
jgi:hypothetical protein